MCRRKPEDPTAGITLSSSRDWEAVGQWEFEYSGLLQREARSIFLF